MHPPATCDKISVQMWVNELSEQKSHKERKRAWMSCQTLRSSSPLELASRTCSERDANLQLRIFEAMDSAEFAKPELFANNETDCAGGATAGGKRQRTSATAAAAHCKATLANMTCERIVLCLEVLDGGCAGALHEVDKRWDNSEKSIG